MSELLACGANLAPGEVLRRQHSRCRRRYAVQPTARDTRSCIFQCSTSGSRLSRSRSWLPEMGDLTGICDSKLRLYCPTRRFGENSPVPIWRPKGKGANVCRLTANHFCPRGSPFFCFARNPFSRIDSMRGEILSDSPREGVARCMFFIILTSSGTWNASVGMSILLQSWSMLPDAQCCVLVFLPSICNVPRHPGVLELKESPTHTTRDRPFCRRGRRWLVVRPSSLSFHFVVGELFPSAGDIVLASYKERWMAERWMRFAQFAAIAVFAFGLAQCVYCGFPGGLNLLRSLQHDCLLR